MIDRACVTLALTCQSCARSFYLRKIHLVQYRNRSEIVAKIQKKRRVTMVKVKELLPNCDTLASLRARVAELEAQVMQRYREHPVA